MPFVVDINDVRQHFPQYEIIRALTPSEQKAAFQVRDSSGTEHCLKIIAPNYAPERVAREITGLQKLDHPNIVKLREYTFTSKDGLDKHYIVEEFVDGFDLTTLLSDWETWGRSDVASFFDSLASALTALELAKIVHRDLKPSNIRVRVDGGPVIIDFGLARLLDMPDLTRTSQGADIGTPLYFAPEQFIGTKHEIDHRTDLFALGVLMFQSLTGVHPFYREGMTWDELSNAVCVERSHLFFQKLEIMPPSWKRIVGRLLEIERAKRLQSGTQLRALLAGVEK